jgi:hypothetical protein
VVFRASVCSICIIWLTNIIRRSAWRSLIRAGSTPQFPQGSVRVLSALVPLGFRGPCLGLQLIIIDGWIVEFYSISLGKTINNNRLLGFI